MSEVLKEPVLELKAVVFDSREGRGPVDLSLGPGDLGYLPGFSRALHLLGVHPLPQGEIRFRGKTWGERTLAETERELCRIGTVVNPRSHPARVWIGNLDVDENVQLASQFDPARSSDEIGERAAILASSFGLQEGLPATRPADTDAQELVLSQWVRAFLPDPLDLLILENPTDFAPPGSVAALVRQIEKARASGTAVIWIDETMPPFSNPGLQGDLVIE